MKFNQHGRLNNQINKNKNLNMETKIDYNNINLINTNFKITPNELVYIMNLYIERTEKFEEIKYFEKEEGIDKLLIKLDTDKTNGISSIDNREEFFGSNKIFIKPLPSFMSFVEEALSDKMIIILLISSIIEIIISMGTIFIKGEKNNMDWLDGISIFFAVVIVVLVGSITNYKKEMKFHKLNNFENENKKYEVIRKGNIKELHSDDILVGDLIKIYNGEILPADILLVEGNNIKIDESSLTGESTAVKKNIYEKCIEEIKLGNNNPSSNLLLGGTNVIEGNGLGIVLAIGEYSQKGIIRGTIDNAQEDNKTPLEIKLNKIADLIGYFGLASAIITFIGLLIHLVIEYIYTKNMPISEWINEILRILILCVSIIIVAIPEGLPLAVTLSLSFSIKKLMDKNNLVRKLHACETMGGANYICTDKTGTLTENKMKVINLITIDKIIKLNNNGNNNKLFDNDDKNNNIFNNIKKNNNLFENENYWEILYISIGLNVDYSLKENENININVEKQDIYEAKNKTDKAFIDFLLKFQIDIDNDITKKYIMFNNYKKFPFDSLKKRMSIMIKNNSFPTGYRLFTKGGAENALLFCNKYISEKDGKIYELNEEKKNYINEQIEAMNKKMMRSLFIGYKDITEEEYNKGFEPDENDIYIDQKEIIFISVFCLRDSLRSDIDHSVEKCHEAHVKVIMVTGDNIMTATAIGKECHILPSFINLDNLTEKEIEQNPNEINIKEKKDNHISELINNQPYAITGNSFYTIIDGIYCETCNEDSINCKCPKSEIEAKELQKRHGGNKKAVKKDAIKNMENFKKIIKNLYILARAQPLHKYALVLGLKALGNVVAVTGDGTNDAPALSKSDVGFAMIDGTDISKDASDIVILDNNFSSIVTAIIYGRSIYENIRKFLQFQLTVNFAACFLVFICTCIGNETPLTSIQMLWVNLIMDSLGALALATEPPYDSLLNRLPTKKDESIINGKMWKHILLQSLCELTLLLLIYFYGPDFIKEDKKDILRTHYEIFNCFGTLPGKLDFNENYKYILDGRENSWPKYIHINESRIEIEEYNCKKYLPHNPHDWPHFSLYEAFEYYIFEYGSTTHMTMIFNIFVFYTLFNQINCRIIDDSLNICARINKGYMFIIITLCEMGVQILLVEFGGRIFDCIYGGLSLKQWLICMGFSLLTFIFNYLIKFISIENNINSYINEKKIEERIKNIDESEIEMQNVFDID